MESITSNEFLNSVLEAEAWKEISRKESFSMDMLEKFAAKLDWEEISDNRDVLWTIDGVSKFASRIDWEEFSNSCPDSFICETTLEKFSNRWNWKKLSNCSALYNNWELLEKYADKVDWNEIITNYNIERPLEFINHFQKYIPMSKFQNSNLWDALVEEKSKELIKEIRGLK